MVNNTPNIQRMDIKEIPPLGRVKIILIGDCISLFQMT